MMRANRTTVKTLCIGIAFSEAALLLAGGKKGHRFATAQAKVMIKEPVGGKEASSSDLSIMAEQLEFDRKVIIDILTERTGRSVDEVTSYMEKERYMNAEEAKEFGIMDEITTEV